MGTNHDLRCTGCGLVGRNVPVGRGMAAQWLFFECRVFHCGRCERLVGARVLRHVADLRADLETMDERRWSPDQLADGNRLALRPTELARWLIDAKSPARCECGERLRGSVTFVNDALPCPRCAAVVEAVEVLLWD